MKIKLIYPLIALACLQLFPGSLLGQIKRRSTPPTPAIESNVKAWRTFVSTEGNFSVLLPGSPEKNGQVLNTGVGPLPSYYFDLKTAMAEYHISYMDFPSAFDDQGALKAAYDGGRDQTLSSSGLSLVSDRDFTVDGHIGRHFSAVGKDQLFNNRIVAVGKRLYMLVIVTRDYRKNPLATIKRYETTINRFLDSFKLINGATETDAPFPDEAKARVSVDLGRIENSVYINDYYGFKVSLPESWHPVERETTDAAIQVNKEMIKGSDKQVNERVEASIARTVVFFTVTKFPLRTPNVTQAMLQCGVERLEGKNVEARVYLQNNRDVMLNSPLQFKLLRDVYPETIGGLSFFVMDMQQTAGDITIKQKYYATIRKGHALFFIANYFDESDRLKMEKALHGLIFQ